MMWRGQSILPAMHTRTAPIMMCIAGFSRRLGSAVFLSASPLKDLVRYRCDAFYDTQHYELDFTIVVRPCEDPAEASR